MNTPWNAGSPDDPDDPPPLFDLDAVPEAIPFEADLPQEKCWRCGKLVEPERGRCPICEAQLHRSAPPRRAFSRPRRPANSIHDDIRSVKVILWAFVLLLSVSVVQAWYVHSKLNFAWMPRQQQKQVLLDQLMVFSAVDSLLLFLALAWAKSPPSVIASTDRKILMWGLALPLLGLLIGGNFLYHYLLMEFIGAHNPNEIIALELKDHPILMVMLVCIQPAIVEELFFRYLAFGHLRKVMGDHGAIWVSSVMFGVAHIHVPLSVPMLMTVGMGLGYARWMSGSMILPMLMHGLHNLIVLIVEAN